MLLLASMLTEVTHLSINAYILGLRPSIFPALATLRHLRALKRADTGRPPHVQDEAAAV